MATNCLQQQRQWTLTRCVLDAKGKPPPPEKRDGAPVEGGCSKQSSNSLDWRGGVLGGLLDGYLCRHLQQEGGKVDSTISSYRGKAHELARQILKEGEPVCEHHVPHVSGGSTHELKTKTSLLRMRWVCLKPQQRHLQKRRRRKSPLAPHSRICMQPLEWPGIKKTGAKQELEKRLDEPLQAARRYRVKELGM